MQISSANYNQLLLEIRNEKKRKSLYSSDTTLWSCHRGMYILCIKCLPEVSDLKDFSQKPAEMRQIVLKWHFPMEWKEMNQPWSFLVSLTTHFLSQIYHSLNQYNRPNSLSSLPQPLQLRKVAPHIHYAFKASNIYSSHSKQHKDCMG